MKKLFWVGVALALGFLFRDRLLEMAPWEHSGFSLPGVVISVLGSIVAALIAHAVVTTMRLRSVWNVTSLILGGDLFYSYLGHWLAGYPSIGDYWGGFISGALASAFLVGALYGAKAVWTGQTEESFKSDDRYDPKDA